MSKFYDDIKNFSNNFNEFINTFLELDDKAPFDNNLLELIKENFFAAYEHNSKVVNNLDDLLYNYSTEFKANMDLYHKGKNLLKDEIIEEKKNIVDKYEKKTLEIEKDMNKISEENERKKEAHKIDIDYFIISNNQNLDMFDIEHNENITRFNYQAENASLTYQTSISSNNSQLEKRLEKIKTDHSYSLIDFDVETNNIIKGYNDKIDETNTIISDSIKDFAKIQAAHKEQKYKEYVDLNDKIRKLVNETRKKNVEERSQYTKNQSVNQNEKDQKRNDYQLESQSISREFVLNMNDLNESMAKIRSDFNTNTENEKKDLQYKLLDLHKEQDKVISSIYFSNSDEKYKRRQIRQKNKSYFSYSNLEKTQAEKTLNHLKKSFLLDSENNTYDKKVLELNRTYSLKSINEKELHDNKYYQELNNLDENDLNYKLAIINNDYNKAANLIRLDSTLKTIDIDKDFEKLDMLHQIELEKIITRAKKIKIDLDSVKKMYEIIHKNEDMKFQKTTNYLVVHNLLEIEKDRVLNEYNQMQHDLNVEKANELLNYSKTNIKLKNYKYKQLKYAEIAIEKAILENDLYILSHKNVINSHHEENEIKTSVINNQFKVDYLSSSVLDKRFNKELKAVNQIISMFIFSTNELTNIMFRILDIVFDNIIFRPEYHDIIKSFVDRLVKIGYDHFASLGESLIELIKKVISDRVQFEESFKFKVSYELVNSTYEQESTVLHKRKNELEELLDGYQNKINDFNALIFTIQNQILYIKDPKNYALYDKVNAKKNLAILTNRMNSITAEANENIAKIEPLKLEIASVDSRIKQLDLDYNNKLSEIKRRQYYSALAYHNLQDDIINCIGEINKELVQLLLSQKDSKITSVNYESIINKKKDEVESAIGTFNTNIYEAINMFYTSEKKEQDDGLSSIKLEYKNSLDKVNQELEENLEIEKKKDIRNRKSLNHNIKRKHIQYANVEKKCDNIIKKNNYTHNKEANDIIERTSNATQKFYDELYAVCDNQKSIVDDYEETMKNLEQEYQDSIKKLVDDANGMKNRLDQELNSYITKRQNNISNIPEKTKLDKYNNQQETKRYNQDIDNNTAQAKLDFVEKRKELNNNIAQINITFGKNIVQINNERKIQLRREKKNHNIQLRHLK